MEETGINNWYFGGYTWWERRKLARLHSENKTSGGQSGMVWSVRYFGHFLIFCLFYLSQGLHHVPIFHHHHSKERVGWEEIPLMSGYVFFLLVTYGFHLTQPCHCLRAPSPTSSSLGSLVPFNKWRGRHGGVDPCAMCVDIAGVCVQWGLLIGHLEVWETTEISSRNRSERMG